MGAVPVPAASRLIQLSADMLGKAAEDEPSAWALTPSQETQKKLLAPSWSLEPSGE